MRESTLLEQHRSALTGHCYRMMGSAVDAEDAVQETLVRALRGLEQFEQRAAVRTWLYRIATNVCLDMLAQKEKRARPVESGSPGSIEGPFDTLPASHWLEPIPDDRAIPADSDPAEAAALKESIRLAFVSALQDLPAKQRAALLLTDVLGWPAAEVASALDTTVASVNSALQRARATVEKRKIQGGRIALNAEEVRLVEQYQAAFLSYDVDALVSLLREDGTMSMPPYKLWLRGPDVIRQWMLGPGCGCRGSRLIRLSACGGAPAFGQFRPGGPEGTFTPWAIIVLELSEGRIAAINTFLETATLFPIFGLPKSLPASA